MSKCIALVAHDACKQDLVDWVGYNWEKLHRHDLVCTGTTGRLVQEIMEQKLRENGQSGLQVERLKSGPLGGDQQLGARIAEGRVHLFVFFWDPMTPQPHDVDVKALLRIATMYNLPTATNRATADFLISSPLFDEPYQHQRLNLDDYLNRPL